MAYYEGQRVGLGLDLRDEVEKAVRMLRRDPERWPLSKGSALRKCPVARFSFNVLYREFEDRIWIAAIAHQKRRPGYWSRRTPE